MHSWGCRCRALAVISKQHSFLVINFTKLFYKIFLALWGKNSPFVMLWCLLVSCCLWYWVVTSELSVFLSVAVKTTKKMLSFVVDHVSEPLVCKRFFYVILLIIYEWMSSNGNSNELGSWDLDLIFFYFLNSLKYFEVDHGYLNLPLVSSTICVSENIIVYNKNSVITLKVTSVIFKFI